RTRSATTASSSTSSTIGGSCTTRSTPAPRGPPSVRTSPAGPAATPASRSRWRRCASGVTTRWSGSVSSGPGRGRGSGVGTGLLLARLALRCEQYWATDFSEQVIGELRRHVAADPALAKRVSLRIQAAHDPSGLPPAAFDTIVVNSVAQYFPSADYLAEV